MIDLSTHVPDVVNQVLYEDVTGIVLLGFSYGGFVVTGALEHIAARVRRLVYLDAFVPTTGNSARAHAGNGGGASGPGRGLAGAPPERTSMTRPRASMAARRTPHPIGVSRGTVAWHPPKSSGSPARRRSDAGPAH